MTIVSTLTGKIAIKHPVLGLLCREDGAILNSKSKGMSFAYTYGSRCSGGYLHVQYKGKTYAVHRLVAEAFLPNREHLPQVDHIDRDKANNAVLNLRWVTAKENMRNRDDVDHSLKIHGIRWCEDRCAYDKSHRSRTLAILSAEGKNSKTCFLPDDIYNELKPLSPKERTARYCAWKQNRSKLFQA